MKKIFVNGQEYSFKCVATLPKKINNDIGVLVQLEVFKNGKSVYRIENE